MSVQLHVKVLDDSISKRCRKGKSKDTVEDYVDVLKKYQRWPFPPIDVYHDGSSYWIADGYHRWCAAVKTKRENVPCNVHNGSEMDALKFAFSCNQSHGLRISNEDKRHRVLEALKEPTLKSMQIQKLADICGVSHTLVRSIKNPKAFKAVQERHQKKKATKATKAAKASSNGKAKVDEPNDPFAERDEVNACPVCKSHWWVQDENTDWRCDSCDHPFGVEPDDGLTKKVKTTAKKDKTQREKDFDLFKKHFKKLIHELNSLESTYKWNGSVVHEGFKEAWNGISG